ncbi:MAG TPA: hypothetical protein VM939_11670, partial [Gemmatimonadaceae bacterium]|nr:hypothetical protein [Gemmatimonadaceae bacterium]
LMAPWCIESRLAKAADNPSSDCWIFPVLQFREFPGDMSLLWNRMQTERKDATRFASSDPPWHTSGPLWRKGALQTFGGFNELVLYGDDSDMHLRALLSGIKTSQYPDALPDVFVRRSNLPRITNSLSPELIESRRLRLREGTKLLKASAGTEPLACWEAQYFTEAEFLLFNHPESSEPVEKVLDAWEDEFRPQPVLRGMVRTYFAIALASRRRAYLIVRIARRIAMKLLPSAFFAGAGAQSPATAAETVMLEVQKRMSLSQAPPL